VTVGVVFVENLRMKEGILFANRDETDSGSSGLPGMDLVQCCCWW